jgi:hypothetical protein
MPSTETILAALGRAANDWRGLAIVWHLLLAALVVALVWGWRPSVRIAAAILATPLASVAATAWLSGNPFNGMVFVALFAGLARAAFHLPGAPLRMASSAWLAGAAAVVGFGSVYPHFIRAESWVDYAVSSPFGVIPCPTLSVVIGMTLAIANLRTRAWTAPLLLGGVLYAALGVFALGVALDVGLFVAAGLLGTALAGTRAWRSVRANGAERERWLPGDDLIADPLGVFTHAITIRRAVRDVWPWLVQMGAGTRAGWCSSDCLDHPPYPEARRLDPELQAATARARFALPGVIDGFTLLRLEPEHALVLGWTPPGGQTRVTWAFILEPRASDARLIVRVRGARDYRFHGLPRAWSFIVIRFVHFMAQRQQLLDIAQRAESLAAMTNSIAPAPASGR